MNPTRSSQPETNLTIISQHCTRRNGKGYNSTIPPITPYYYQGRYKVAELLHLEALRIRKRVLGETHPDLAQSLNNLIYMTTKGGRCEDSLNPRLRHNI